jgi:outer membrane lipoprotein-sorting protein
MKCSPILLPLSLAAALATTRGAAGTVPTECRDYRSKGQIRVRLQPDLPVKPGETPNELGCRIEQVFVRPDRMLLNMDWFGLKQQMLAQGSIEQIYQPTMGVVIEKKYLNLNKTDENPILALQTSMVQCGKLLREAKSAHPIAKEKVLQYDCEVIEADSKEVMEKMGDLVSPGKNSALQNGKIKAWVVNGYGVPVKLEIFTTAGNLAASLTMEDLQFNTGVKAEELKLDLPADTKKVSIEVDLAEKDWQQKMERDLRKAVAGLSAQPRS